MLHESPPMRGEYPRHFGLARPLQSGDMTLALIAYAALAVSYVLSSIPLVRQALGRPRHSSIVAMPARRRRRPQMA